MLTVRALAGSEPFPVADAGQVREDTPRAGRWPKEAQDLGRRDVFSRMSHTEVLLRISHQDSPSTDGQERHLCRWAPGVGRAPSASQLEPVPTGRARSPWRLAAGLASGVDRGLQRVRIPGEKTSLNDEGTFEEEVRGDRRRDRHALISLVPCLP